ncbi:hypothetical protein HGRIS_008378 [Hohenbuehelia grisea]|uniref:WD40 repeat-like protein n=1 Tax=Hohenbuehelia grisea TaxID=104357 RepID=A0ABR3J891_9AGAR
MQSNWDNGSDNADASANDDVSSVLSSLFGLQGANRRDNGQQYTISTQGITLADLSRLLNRGGIRIEDDDDDDDYEDEEFSPPGETADAPLAVPTGEPDPVGVELLMSGEFGSVSNKMRSREDERNVARHFLNRGSSSRPVHTKEPYLQDLVPNTNGTAVAKFDDNVYTAQFSADSSFFYTCGQDFRLHVFDMSAMPDSSGQTPRRHERNHEDQHLQTNLKVLKSVQGHHGRWTITDANLSPDNERLIYSSLHPTVYMTSVHDDSTLQTPIPFADTPSARRRRTWLDDYSSDSFGIYSTRFSADGNEVIAGGSGMIFVYDLLANRRTVKIMAHDDDVNSCTWADTASGNVLVSASDDSYLKVWDRRSLGSSNTPSGVLVGHTEGITYVSAKGDGRYVISNGKDQALRLWDLRKMRSSAEFERMGYNNYGMRGFDYR